MDFRAEQLLKPGFRLVIMIAKHVCHHVPKRILQLYTTYQLLVFVVKD